MNSNDFNLDTWKISCDITNQNAIAYKGNSKRLSMCLEKYPELKELFVGISDEFVIINLKNLQSLDPFTYNGKIYKDIKWNCSNKRWYIVFTVADDVTFNLNGINIVNDEFDSLNEDQISAKNRFKTKISDLYHKIKEYEQEITKYKNLISHYKEFEEFLNKKTLKETD